MGGRVRLFVGNSGSGWIGLTFRRVGSSRVVEKWPVDNSEYTSPSLDQSGGLSGSHRGGPSWGSSMGPRGGLIDGPSGNPRELEQYLAKARTSGEREPERGLERGRSGVLAAWSCVCHVLLFFSIFVSIWLSVSFFCLPDRTFQKGPEWEPELGPKETQATLAKAQTGARSEVSAGARLRLEKDRTGARSEAMTLGSERCLKGPERGSKRGHHDGGLVQYTLSCADFLFFFLSFFLFVSFFSFFRLPGPGLSKWPGLISHGLIGLCLDPALFPGQLGPLNPSSFRLDG